MLWGLAEACNTLAKIIAPVHLVFTVIYQFFIGKDLTAAEKLKKAPQNPPHPKQFYCPMRFTFS